MRGYNIPRGIELRRWSINIIRRGYRTKESVLYQGGIELRRGSNIPSGYRTKESVSYKGSTELRSVYHTKGV